MYTLQIKALAFKLLFMYMYALSRKPKKPFCTQQDHWKSRKILISTVASYLVERYKVHLAEGNVTLSIKLHKISLRPGDIAECCTNV